MIIKGDMQGAGGVEFATFRLKEGVTEADLLALAHRVESEFLVQQSELIVHCLLRGADGLYADLVTGPQPVTGRSLLPAVVAQCSGRGVPDTAGS